jgi:hypothetical protein
MSEESYFIVARIAEHIEPINRGDRYEDPLDAALRELTLGEVVGGGTEFSEDEGVKFGDIEIEVVNLDRGIEACLRVLDQLGAPAGSFLLVDIDGQERAIPFGHKECTAIILDGVNLSQEIYRTTDINELVELLEGELDGGRIGELRGAWAGPTQTTIFIYGDDARRIVEAVETTLREYPLCHNARVVVGFRHPDGPFAEYRLPQMT